MQQGSVQIEEQALAAATAETVVQLVAAANHAIKILRWGVFFDGVSVTGEPVEIEIQRQTTAGTSSAGTMVKLNDSNADTLDTTARISFTAEPTKTGILECYLIHPQQGIMVMYPLGQELVVGAGDRVGIEVTAPAVVNCRAFMVFQE